MFLSHADYAESAESTRSARVCHSGRTASFPDSGGECSLCLTKKCWLGTSCFVDKLILRRTCLLNAENIYICSS